VRRGRERAVGHGLATDSKRQEERGEETYSSCGAIRLRHLRCCPVGSRGLLRGKLGAMLGEALLELLGRLVLDFLGRPLHGMPAGRISRGGGALSLGLVKVLDDALVVLLQDVLGDALHAEDLDVEAGAVGQGVLDALQRFFVDLVHVDREAWVITTSASGSIEKDGTREGEESVYRLLCSTACRIART